MSNYGKQRKDVKVGRVKGERRASQSEKFGGGKKRGGISVDAGTGQEKEVDPPLVLIEWFDSFGCSSNWQKLEIESIGPLVCRSVGWLAYDGPACKVIVPHQTDRNHASVSQQGCGDMTIPTQSIIRVRRLR